MSDQCVKCGGTKNLKRGWTNCWYDSENCERSHVSDVHGSMPGTGGLPSHNWVPHDISIEISKRWEILN
jgi:hypothetical protein